MATGRILHILLITLVVYQQLVEVVSEVNLLLNACVDEYGNYTQNSVYQKNLNTLLTELSSQASVVKFGNYSVGRSPNNISGSYQCREDYSEEVCSECIQDARAKVVQECQSREAAIYYNECMLRYSHRYLYFSRFWSYLNVSNYSLFAPILENTFESLIKDTAQGSSRFGHFATREANLTIFTKLYSLAQCSPDLDTYECSSCLSQAKDSMIDCCIPLHSARSYAMVILPSCQLRYDTTAPFYNELPELIAPSPALLSKPAKKLERKKSRSVIVVITVAASIGALLLLSVTYLFVHRKKSSATELPGLCTKGRLLGKKLANQTVLETEFVEYDFATMRAATHNFIIDNKLGEGGFGAVYKGTLKSGQEVAIKRLSSDSRQGPNEFMNEARLVARLQHRNLVKLLGFCSGGEEKLLVYEFMPNTSLDRFLLDPTKRASLDWDMRYKIILGISRGLQYLHEDSRLIIIHRDLKTSNILLDGDMNPKIADFGMARLFGGEQKFGNTSHIAGTYGYMAPEYLINGEYSDKSDVYSFGVIVLEIVSGQRNVISHPSLQREDLTLHAWRLWKEERCLELIDPTIQSNCARIEVMRCIHVAMLCVQGNAVHRPTMAAVVLMLTGSIVIPLPFDPAMSPIKDNDVQMTENSKGYNESGESSTISVSSSVQLSYTYPR